MICAAFAIPGVINLPTGGYAYDRRVLSLLPQAGVAVEHLPLPGGFPAPSVADLDETKRLLADVPPSAVLLADGLAYGAMPTEVIRAARGPIVALVHHPLCLEEGLSKARQMELHALEKTALGLARAVITTSRTTARTVVKDFAVPEQRIRVAEPGTEPAPRAKEGDGPVRLLSVGSIVPRKAYDVLVRALGPLGDRAWHLTIAGPCDRSKEAVASLQEAIAQTGLDSRITLMGPVSESQLGGLYAAADIFVLSSLYEGYGMVLGEAMARGLPIVCTTGGAAAETAPAGAAIKVPPGEVGALSAAIRSVLDSRDLRRQMSDASWHAGQSLPRWEDTARIIAETIREVAP